MINKLTKKKLNNWNKTKNIYLDWISDNRLKRIFSREIIYEGLSLWWVNSLTFKDNMIDKSWYCDLNNILNYNIKPKSSNNQFFFIFIYLRMLKNFLRVILWSIIIKLFSNTRKLSHKAKNVFYCYNYNFFSRRTDALTAEQVGENIYKVSFPFLGGSVVFEKTIDQFKSENPTKKINHIYTVPNPLRLKKADGLIFYIMTEDKL